MGTNSPDDYYALLGIDSNADSAKLRRAWRQLALRWHPDRAGSGATATFQKLSEAYTVLSDPTARAAYDRRRGTAARSSGVSSGDATGAPPATARHRAPGAMLSRLSGALNGLLACGAARRAEGDVIELFLNAHEAAQGGMVTISMRVPVRCSACPPDATASCTRCRGTRTVEELFSAWLAVPPDVVDGTLLMPSAQLRGMLRSVSFRVRRRGPL
ncbi:MAG: DnaJ domain-containing protein [Myxococcaceae bacterium]|nr:DnaJ domain-containing protein [Myxococcaceae bacterium]